MILSGPNPPNGGRGPDPVQPENYLLQQNNWRKLTLVYLHGDVAANPGEVTSGFMGIDYMQDLTPNLCKSTTSLATKQLIDTRDGKSYWVTKLKDNNCWMTQNLDYDGGGTPIIPSAWTTSGSPTNVTNTTAVYYDRGMVGADGNAVTDSHLLVGNYYSWAAATNGSGNGISSGNASDSICPAGWQLPTNSGNGSFSNLLSGISTSSDSALLVAPYYFVRGGYVNPGSLYDAGGQGRYWSSTASASTNAYNLYFDSSSVLPSNNRSRYLGLSVRCLVQGS